jgi:isopropylmalate/homocitrate/citramalate synthase
MADKNEPWKSENWWVSPWNFMEEVTKNSKAVKRPAIVDVTLRDGEQQAGIIFSKDEKIRLAEEIAALGVYRIEPCMPIISKEDEGALREIVKRKLGPKIYAGCRSVVDEIRLAADCGVDGVDVGTPSSKHLIQQGLGWADPEQAIEAAIKATKLAKDLGLEVSFFPIDGSRADMEWYFHFIDRVEKEGHFDALVLSDTWGTLSPQGAAQFVSKVKERVKKPLEVHFHNHFGMAVANSVAGVLSGADRIHTAVTGIGEGSGNCCTEELVMSLLVLQGIDMGLKYDRLYELSKLVRNTAGVTANRPIVGENTYDLETGEGVIFYRKVWDDQPTILYPLLPKFVGHEDPKVVIGKKSGTDSVLLWAEKLGFELSKDEAKKIVPHIKELAIKTGRLLTEEEFREIVQNAKAG